MTLFTVDLYTKSWVLNLRCFQGLLIKWGSSHQGSPHRGQSKLSYSRPSHQTGKACSGRGRGSEIQSPSAQMMSVRAQGPLWDFSSPFSCHSTSTPVSLGSRVPGQPQLPRRYSPGGTLLPPASSVSAPQSSAPVEAASDLYGAIYWPSAN